MKLYRLVFTVALLSFVATNFPFGKLGIYGRFPSLGLLFVGTLILVSRLHVRDFSTVLAASYLFLTYSFITVYWTENIWLSLAKWILYTAVSLVFFLAGLIIGQNDSPDRNPFDPIKWVLISIIVSSMFALATGFGWTNENFRGYSGNSNALGASLMLTTPWLIYEIALCWRRGWSRWSKRFLVLIAFLDFSIMLATHSRAALCGFFVLPVFVVQRLKLSRRLTLAYFVLLAFVAVSLLRPSAFDAIYHSFIMKRSDSMSSSRGEQMTDSWEAAKQGGVLGSGFGVSVGQARYWEFTTFSEVSREKGNSILAIVEETGLVGLCLYFSIIVSLGFAISKYRRTPDADQKLLASLVFGYLLAAFIHGQFEAWFLSFGPDVSVYWATLGLALGRLSKKNPENEQNNSMEASSGARIFIPAALPRR